MSAVLHLNNIHKSFGELEVLKGVDLTAAKGEVVAMIGSSGSGKSTLLRCCNLLEVPQQGDIEFEGEAITWKGQGRTGVRPDEEQVRRVRANLSMVFQQFNLWAHMTILENVIEAPMQVKKTPRAEAVDRARALLDKVGIGDKADNFPSALSGGHSSAQPSRGRSRWNRRRCCSMSQPVRLIPSWKVRCSKSSAHWLTKDARCCWSPTT